MGKATLIRKVKALYEIKRSKGEVTTPQSFFMLYAGNDGRMTRAELDAMLIAAGIDWFRQSYVDGVFEAIDTSPKDEAITWLEYHALVDPQR